MSINLIDYKWQKNERAIKIRPDEFYIYICVNVYNLTFYLKLLCFWHFVLFCQFPSKTVYNRFDENACDTMLSHLNEIHGQLLYVWRE